MELPEGVVVDQDLDGVKITLSPPPKGWLRLGGLVTSLTASLAGVLCLSLLLVGTISAALGTPPSDSLMLQLASILAVVGLSVAAVAFIRTLSRSWLVGPRVVLVQPAVLVVNSIRVPWAEVARISEQAIIVLKSGETVSVAAHGEPQTLAWLAGQLREAHEIARRGDPSEVPVALRALREARSQH